MKDLSIKSEADKLLQEQKQLRQHNSITSGRYDFSQCQLDISFYLLANLNQHEDTYMIHCLDMELITGRKWNYQQFKNCTEDMLGRVFIMDDRKEKTYTQFVLFQRFKYYEGQGTIEVKLSEDAKPLFYDLKAGYTFLQLKSVLSMTSKYAKRIYGLCCQWRSLGFKEYELKEFKSILGLIDEKTGKEQFVQITPFRQDLLEVAKKQINQCTDIQFDYKLEKKFHSRSFNSITIYINKPDVKQLNLELEQSDIDFNQSLKEQMEIKIIMSYGLSEQQAQTILSKGTIEEFQDAIEYVKKTITKQKVNNQIAYLCGVLKNKGLM